MPVARRWIFAATTLAVVAAGPAPASRKPCRDPHGRVIPCAKPSPAASPSPRPRDAAGRFAPDAKPGAAPH